MFDHHPRLFPPPYHWISNNVNPKYLKFLSLRNLQCERKNFNTTLLQQKLGLLLKWLQFSQKLKFVFAPSLLVLFFTISDVSGFVKYIVFPCFFANSWDLLQIVSTRFLNNVFGWTFQLTTVDPVSYDLPSEKKGFFNWVVNMMMPYSLLNPLI